MRGLFLSRKGGESKALRERLATNLAAYVARIQVADSTIIEYALPRFVNKANAAVHVATPTDILPFMTMPKSKEIVRCMILASGD